MITVIQRVLSSSVSVDGEVVASIDKGIMALLAFEFNDDWDKAEKMMDKIINYRIFSDEQGKMNLSLIDIKADLLIVPQFTLAANTKKGKRPGFDNAMKPQLAEEFFQKFSLELKNKYRNTQFGIFAADMKVSLVNDGPVTFIIKID